MSVAHFYRRKALHFPTGVYSRSSPSSVTPITCEPGEAKRYDVDPFAWLRDVLWRRRRLAVSLLRQEKTIKRGAKCKRMACALDLNYLLKVFHNAIIDA